MDIKAILAAFALLTSLQSGAQSLYPGQYAEKRVVRDLAEPEADSRAMPNMPRASIFMTATMSM